MKNDNEEQDLMEEFAVSYGDQVPHGSTRFKRVIRLDINNAKAGQDIGFRVLKTDIVFDEAKYKDAAPTLANRSFELLQSDPRGVEEWGTIFEELSKSPDLTDTIRSNLRKEEYNFSSWGLDNTIDSSAAIIIRSNIDNLRFLSNPTKFESTEERKLFHIFRTSGPKSQCGLIPRDDKVEIFGDGIRIYKINLLMLIGFFGNEENIKYSQENYSLHVNPLNIKTKLTIKSKHYEINADNSQCGPPWTHTCKPD